MTLDIVSAGVLDPVGSAARQPVIVAFLIFIGVSLLWLFTLATGEKESTEGLYLADRSLSSSFNGVALAGEHISVVTLLQTCGGVALLGYDGFIFALDNLLAFGVLLLLAQKIRNSGRYTLGDLFSLRASGPGPRIAAAVVTLAITIPILMVQLGAAGVSAALLIGLPTDGAEVVCTVLMGCMVACFAAVAGLRGTSFMQAAKVPITLLTLTVVTVLALRNFEWDPGSLLSAAADKSVAPDGYMESGLWLVTSKLGTLNTFGNHFVAILGLAVMPHLILRIGGSRSGHSARRSVRTAVWLAGAFVLLLIATGFSAAAVVGAADLGAVDASGQSAPIQLASEVLSHGSTGRVVLLTVMACVIFLVVLTTVTSVTFAAAVSLAHDVFARGGRRRSDTREVGAMRLVAVVVCGVAVSLAAAIHQYQSQFLISFSIAVGASCIFPALVYSFFWRRFNRRGLLWSVCGALLLCAVLTVFSPTVSGTPMAMWPDANFDWYPFQSPGLVSVPAAFFLGWLGSVTSSGDSELDFRRIQYKLLTGTEAGQPARTPGRDGSLTAGR